MDAENLKWTANMYNLDNHKFKEFDCLFKLKMVYFDKIGPLD